MSDTPKTNAGNWLSFADEDLRAAAATQQHQLHAIACFHAQQAAEKVIKGLILHSRGNVPKQHSLLRLAEMSQNKPLFDNFRPQLEFLDKFYVPTRYPDAFPGTLPEGAPTATDSQKAIAVAQELVDFVKQNIGQD